MMATAMNPMASARSLFGRYRFWWLVRAVSNSIGGILSGMVASSMASAQKTIATRPQIQTKISPAAGRGVTGCRQSTIAVSHHFQESSLVSL